jgi:hypothetical protein
MTYPSNQDNDQNDFVQIDVQYLSPSPLHRICDVIRLARKTQFSVCHADMSLMQNNDVDWVLWIVYFRG